jgi:beta-galactosidase
MWVLIRPGPYVCAEWDFGGQPYWLLRDKSELRTTNPNYVNPSRRYVQRVAKELKNYQIEQGGPIIMLQIENEYGFYGTNNTWPILLKQLWDETGIIKIPYYTADPSKGLKVGKNKDLEFN